MATVTDALGNLRVVYRAIPFFGPLAVEGEPLRGLLFIAEDPDGHLFLIGTYHLEDEMLVGWESEWHLEDFLALAELVEERGLGFKRRRPTLRVKSPPTART